MSITIIQTCVQFVKSTTKLFREHDRVLIQQETLNNRADSIKDGVIHLDFTSSDNNIVSFKVRHTELLQKVIDAYCMMQSFRDIKLKQDNVILNSNETLFELGTKKLPSVCLLKYVYKNIPV